MWLSLTLPSIFTYTGILAVAGLVAFGAYNALTKFTKTKGGGYRGPSNAKALEYGTRKHTSDDDADWLRGTTAAQSPSKAQRRRK